MDDDDDEIRVRRKVQPSVSYLAPIVSNLTSSLSLIYY